MSEPLVSSPFAEKAVLGLMLKYPMTTGVSRVLQERDWDDIRHSILFSALVDVYDDSGPDVRLSDVYEELRRAETFDPIGGEAYLNELMNAAYIMGPDDIQPLVLILRGYRLVRDAQEMVRRKMKNGTT